VGHTAPHRVQHSDVYTAECCYKDDYMVGVYTADDTEVYTDDVSTTSDTDSCRHHMEHCKVYYMACDHSVTDKRLYMADTTHHRMPAVYNNAFIHSPAPYRGSLSQYLNVRTSSEFNSKVEVNKNN